jgi:hypothetical protein
MAPGPQFEQIPERADPARPATPSLVPSAGGAAGAVLALQRSAGNAAVASLLAPGRPTLSRQDPPVTTPASEYDRGTAGNDWDLAVRSLAAMTPEDRRTRLAAATTERLLSLATAAEHADLADVRNELAAKLAEPAHAARAQQLRYDAEFAAALAASDWDRLARALNQYDDAGMDAKLGTLGLEPLNHVSEAALRGGAPLARARAHAETARVAKLGQEWEAAARAGDWPRAVTLVQAYNDIDLPLKIGALTFDQVSALCQAADKMLPAYERVRRIAEPIRVAKLGQEYEAAVNASNWARAIDLLNAYNDLDLLPRARFIAGKGAPALAAAAAAANTRWAADDNNRVRRTLSFLGVESQTGAAARPAGALPGAMSGGTTQPGVAVPGGTVTVTSGQSLAGVPGATWFGFDYQGAQAQQTGWIQFIARNIEKFDASGTSLGFHPGTWTPSGQGPRTLSTTAAPIWYLDTLSNQMPFYESPLTAAAGGAAAAGGHQTGPTQTAMYDAPGAPQALVSAAFGAPNVKRVKARAVFESYLVRGMDVLSKSTMTVEWDYPVAPGAAGFVAPSPVQTPGATTYPGKITSAQFNSIVARFPTFAYLPHGP